MKKFLVFLFALTLSLMVNAQAAGDKLFIEGQQLQKVMTVASQNQAIKKFQAAKVVYTSADKKTMCDNQIAICNNNLKSLKNKTTPKKKKEDKADDKQSPEPEPTPVANTRRDVELSISESRLDFKNKPKKGATQSVMVKCNYDDWRVAAKPAWVEVYTAKDKFTVEAYENPDEDGRSGIVSIKCDDVQVDLIINQDGLSGVGKFFKNLKKKKKDPKE